MKTVRFFPLILLLSLGSQAQSSTNVQYINPPNVPHPPGYTHAVIVPASKLVFLAGQVGLNSKGELVGKDDFRAQATQAFENTRPYWQPLAPHPTTWFDSTITSPAWTMTSSRSFVKCAIST